MDPIVENGLQTGLLVAAASGSGSPCLDLRRIDGELIKMCQDADLVILEGMGRALLTNFNATFQCDSLKIGVIKNLKLAELFKAQLYEGVCIFAAKEQDIESEGLDANSANRDTQHEDSIFD
jgi:type II pantothenate kinase